MLDVIWSNWLTAVHFKQPPSLPLSHTQDAHPWFHLSFQYLTPTEFTPPKSNRLGENHTLLTRSKVSCTELIWSMRIIDFWTVITRIPLLSTTPFPLKYSDFRIHVHELDWRFITTQSYKQQLRTYRFNRGIDWPAGSLALWGRVLLA